MNDLLKLLIKTIITGFGLALGALIFHKLWLKAVKHKTPIGNFLKIALIFLGSLTLVYSLYWFGGFIVIIHKTHPFLSDFLNNASSICLLISTSVLITSLIVLLIKLNRTLK